MLSIVSCLPQWWRLGGGFKPSDWATCDGCQLLNHFPRAGVLHRKVCAPPLLSVEMASRIAAAHPVRPHHAAAATAFAKPLPPNLYVFLNLALVM